MKRNREKKNEQQMLLLNDNASHDYNTVGTQLIGYLVPINRTFCRRITMYIFCGFKVKPEIAFNLIQVWMIYTAYSITYSSPRFVVLFSEGGNIAANSNNYIYIHLHIAILILCHSGDEMLWQWTIASPLNPTLNIYNWITGV